MIRSERVVAALDDATRDPAVMAVTIDFWDTLVERAESASVVRMRVCEWVVAEWNLGLSASQLHGAFNDVSKALCIAATQVGRDYEFRASTAWIAVLREMMGSVADLHERAAAVADVEVAENVRATRVHSSVIDALRRLQGIPILVLSDNELAVEQLQSIAAAHDLHLPSVLVSSTEGRTKRSGRLFEAALQELCQPPTNVLHVGDDDWGDRRMPKRLGIRIPVLPIPPVEHGAQTSMPPTGPKMRSAQAVFRPDLLGRAVAHFIRFVEAEIERTSAERVIFVGSEGTFFSQFFAERKRNDDVVYQVTNLGRRHFLGAAIARDPSWVVQRCLVSGIRVAGIGSLAVDPDGSRGSFSEAEQAGRSLVEEFWEAGRVDSGSLPLGAEVYQDVARRRTKDIGADVNSSGLLVVDIGYRATSARAISMTLGRDVTSVGMFGEARYLNGRSGRFTSWLRIATPDEEAPKGSAQATGIPRVLLPLEVLLAAGPRAPRADVQMDVMRRDLSMAAQRELASVGGESSENRLDDVAVWTALIEEPPRAFARSVFRAFHEDDLQGVRGEWVPRSTRILRDRREWLEGSTALLTPVGAVFLDGAVRVAKRVRDLTRGDGRQG